VYVFGSAYCCFCASRGAVATKTKDEKIMSLSRIEAIKAVFDWLEGTHHADIELLERVVEDAGLTLDDDDLIEALATAGWRYLFEPEPPAGRGECYVRDELTAEWLEDT
jgi:hypothetical protein